MANSYRSSFPKGTFLKQALRPTLLFCTANWLFLGCSTAPAPETPHKRGPTPSSQSNTYTEQQEFQSIEDLFSRGATEAAASKASSFSKRYPHSSYAPSLENIRGLIALKKKNYPQAMIHFRKSIELGKDNYTFNQYIYFNLATTQAEAEQLDTALQTLASIDQKVIDKPTKVKIAYLQATIYDKKSLPVEASKSLLSLGQNVSESDLKNNHSPFFKLLEDSLQKISDFALLEKLSQDYENSSLLDTVLYRLSTLALASDNRAASEQYMKTLLSKFPQSTYAANASQVLAPLKEEKAPFNSKVVGVLLPMSGKLSKFGAKSLQGIELAFDLFGTNERNSSGLSLVIEDTGEENEKAMDALNRLVFKHHAAAIIGPMLIKGVDQLSQRAQELGVPLISLARKASSASQSQDFVFQAGLTPQIQTHELAKFAIQNLGLKEFAILYPNDKSGTEPALSFWDSVESLGGKIVGVESYSPGETDFRKAIDRLSGLFYTDARQREVDLLAEEREANNIKKRTRKTEQYFNLKPIADYKVVFIPDEPKAAGQILPTFAYRDIENIKFLGTSSWNSPEFLARAEAYANKSYLVDEYFPETKKPSLINFQKKYRSSFEQDPSTFEVIAYDAALILKSVLSSSHPSSRAEIRDRLKQVKNFAGVTGEIYYKDGQFYRDLSIITVKNGQFTDQ